MLVKSHGDGTKDPGSPASPFPAGTLDSLRPRMDQTTALLGRDFIQTAQAHGPHQPTVGRSLDSRPRPRDNWGLGPYHGPELRGQPYSAVHVSLPPTDEVEGRPGLAHLRSSGAGAEDKGGRRSQLAAHGGYSPPCCHNRGMLFHLPIQTKERGTISSWHDGHASIMTGQGMTVVPYLSTRPSPPPDRQSTTYREGTRRPLREIELGRWPPENSD
jgi:hypothetical protein